MKFLARFLVACALFFVVGHADAATCFWVGGTGNFDNANTASWASSSGGTTGTCAATGGIPKNAADTATFDASSGGGTVTVCGASSANCPSGAGSLNITGITCGAFTGTLDFSVNNPTVTLSNSFSCTGTGTRTLKLGSGTYNLTSLGNSNPWDLTTTTNLTFQAGTSTINMSSAATGQRLFAAGNVTYNVVTIADSGTGFGTETDIGGSPTFGTLTVTGPIRLVAFNNGMTITATTLNINGTYPNAMVLLLNSANANGNRLTVSVASGTPTITGAVIRGVVFSGGATFNATNSIDVSGNTGITINNPPSGGSRCIGC